MTTLKDVWPHLAPETRRWLIDNTNDTVPGDIVREILNAQGYIVSTSWFHDVHPSRIHLSSEQSEWIRQAGGDFGLKAS